MFALAYRGCVAVQWVRDDMHGRGTMVYGTGEKYTGDWVLSVRVGHGELVENDRFTTYRGDFWEGERWGYGTMLYADKSVYEGYFVRGVRHGIGRVTFGPESDKVYYDGEWYDDKIQGHGAALYRDGWVPPVDGWLVVRVATCSLFLAVLHSSFYDGGWKDNLRFDVAAFHAADGSTYIGEYRRDERYGRSSRGVRKYDNGDVYEGQLYKGLRVGWGKCWYANGDQFEGYWTDDVRGGGKGLFQQLSKSHGDEYIGLWKDDVKFCQVGCSCVVCACVRVCVLRVACCVLRVAWRAAH